CSGFRHLRIERVCPRVCRRGGRGGRAADFSRRCGTGIRAPRLHRILRPVMEAFDAAKGADVVGRAAAGEYRPARPCRAGARYGGGMVLAALVRLVLDRFLSADKTHPHALLTDQLAPIPSPITYGHDIEACWLIETAADALANPDMQAEARAAVAALARAP